MKKLDELTIVLDEYRIVCIYLNRHRIVGNKPRPGLKSITREVDRNDIAEALRKPPYFIEQYEEKSGGRTPRALDAALWVCQNCGEASELSSQRCSVCNTPRQ